MDGSLIQMPLAAVEKLNEEAQDQTVLLMEIRDDQREILKVHKERSKAAAGTVAEEPATLYSSEVRAMPSTCTSLQWHLSGAMMPGCGICSMRCSPICI